MAAIFKSLSFIDQEYEHSWAGWFFCSIWFQLWYSNIRLESRVEASPLLLSILLVERGESADAIVIVQAVIHSVSSRVTPEKFSFLIYMELRDPRLLSKIQQWKLPISKILGQGTDRAFLLTYPVCQNSQWAQSYSRRAILNTTDNTSYVAVFNLFTIEYLLVYLSMTFT